MRVGVANDRAEAVVVARTQRSLQTVVVRLVDVSHLKDVAQEGKLGVEGPGGLARAGVGAQSFLVDIPDADQIRAVVANVAKLEREVRVKRVLHVQGPVPNVGSRQVANNAHDGAGICIYRIAGDGTSAEGSVEGRATVPLRKNRRDCQIASRDRATGSGARTVDDSS